MEVIHKLQKPAKLLLYESLSNRWKLSNKDKNTYFNLKRGYEGELLFSKFVEKMKGEGFVLYDMTFEYNQTAFQIDCLIINQTKVHLYEVKNFDGDFYLEGDKFYKKPRQEYLNPFHQLNRAESLLRQLLLSFGFNTSINASVVFVNPTFTLYQAPLDIPAIFPSQIDRHLEFVSNQSVTLTNNMRRLAAKLMEARITDYPFEKPAYNYGQLTKGLVCPVCNKVSVTLMKRSCVCKLCGYKESAANALLRSVKEFQVLFPDKRITTAVIYDWCGETLTPNIIRRVLSNNFKVVGKHKTTYYE